MTKNVKKQIMQSPGEKLAERMEKLLISGNALASYMHVPPNRITDIIRGRRKITPDTSIRLAYVFKNFYLDDDNYWFNLQNDYDMYLELQKKESIIKSVKPMERII